MERSGFPETTVNLILKGAKIFLEKYITLGQKYLANMLELS